MSTSTRLLVFAVALSLFLAFSATPSRADNIITYNVSATLSTGSLSGTTTFDETTNTMTSVDITAPGTGTGPFTIAGGFVNNGGGQTVVGVQDGSGDFLFLNFATATPGSVANYDGGPLGSTTNISVPGSSGFSIISGSLTPAPEPASLSLLGAGLAGLSILRKKLLK